MNMFARDAPKHREIKPCFFCFSAVDQAVKQLGNAIAQSLLASVTEAMTPSLTGMARSISQAPAPETPAPHTPALQPYQEYEYQGGRRGRGANGRGGGNRGRGYRGRGNGRGRYNPYLNHQQDVQEIARLTRELAKERDTRIKLEQTLGNQATQKMGDLHIAQGQGKLLDAHFHWDRVNRIKRMNLEDLISDQVRPRPDSDLQVEGGIMVFCDPKDFPTSQEIKEIKTRGKFGVAMGIHPNYSKENISRFEPSVQLIREQMDQRNLNGLGEVGLDFLKGGNVQKQEQILEWILPLARPEIPLILHVRGISEDSNSELAYDHALRLLIKNNLDKNQAVQLHSFTGTSRTVQRWLKIFPNCYFSFSGLVRNFNPEQIQALRVVPSDRLLLETDSPYLPLRREIRCNVPGYLGETAQVVARIRGESIGELVSNTRNNTNLIFFTQQQQN